MSKLSFSLEYSELPCQGDGVYYALVEDDSLCLGRELAAMGTDGVEPDFVALAEEVVSGPIRRTARASHFVVSKLCFLEHPRDEHDIPGPQLELVANVVISARGAQPFVPILTNKDFPSIFNIEGVGDPAIDEMYRLKTLPAIGDDTFAMQGSKHHTTRYDYENPPQLAIKTDLYYGSSYYVLDSAVAALVLKDEHNQLSLSPKAW